MNSRSPVAIRITSYNVCYTKLLREIPGLIPEIARDAVRAALGLGLVRALPSFAEPAPPPEGDRLRVPHPLNRALLADALHAHGPLPLASVAIGGFRNNFV